MKTGLVLGGQVKGKLPQGTGKGIYGYRYEKAAGRRVVVQAEADVIRRMFRMAASGCSIHGIAKQLTDEGIPRASAEDAGIH
jgi:site-specific DNA recombinase